MSQSGGFADCGRAASVPRTQLRWKFPDFNRRLSDGCRNRVGAVGALGALDGLAIAERDLDLAGLLLLGLGDPDLQHAAVEVGVDCVGVDAVGQGERA